MASKDYTVGYGKPPKDHQFTKGNSGNPKGRPYGSRGIRAKLDAIGNRPITITEGNIKRTVSRQEAFLYQLLASATKGDRHARRDYIKLACEYEQLEGARDEQEPHERDVAVLKSTLQRLEAAAKSLAAADPAHSDSKRDDDDE